MRWFSFLFFFNVIVLTAGSQSSADFINDIKNNCRSYKKLKQVFNRYSDSNVAIVSLYVGHPYFATNEIIYEIDHSSKSDFSSCLKLYVQKDKVIFLELYKNAWEENSLFKYIDSSFSLGILAKHNTKYGTDFSLDDMYAKSNSLFPMFNPYQGSDRFFTRDELSELSKDTKKVFEHILAGDSISVIRYAANFCTEMTGFGAAGLYIWHREINPLDKKATALLQSIQNSKQIVTYYEGGCLIDRLRLSEVTTDALLQELYKKFLLFKRKRNNENPCKDPDPANLL